MMMTFELMRRVLARLHGDEMKSPAIQVRHAESLAAPPIVRLVGATSFVGLELLWIYSDRLFFLMELKVRERRRFLLRRTIGSIRRW